MSLRFRMTDVCVIAAFACAVSGCGGGGGGGGPEPVRSPASTFALTGLGTADADGTYELAAATSYTVAATETLNGQPVTTGPLSVIPSTSKLGVVSGASLKTGIANASGTLKIVDSKTGLAATVSVAVLTTLPLSTGDTLSLAGTSMDELTVPPPSPAPYPSPTVTSGTFRVDETVTSTGASFDGTDGLAEIGLTETDVVPTGKRTTTSTLYTGFVPTGSGTDLRVYGYDSRDSTGVTTSVVYGVGNGVIGMLPDITESAFTNTAAETFVEHDPDGTVANRTVAADGTYVETDAFAGGGTQTIETHADYSASIKGLSGLPIDVMLSAPASPPPDAVDPIATIAYDISSSGSELASGSIQDWTGGFPIFSDHARKTFGVGLDSRCTFPVKLATTPTTITEDQAIDHNDTALGISESRHVTLEEIAGYGTICASFEDIIGTYYDYTGGSQPIATGVNVALSSNREPLRSEVILAFANFVDSSIAGASHASAAARFSRGLSPDEAMRVATPLFEQRVEAVRRAQRAALLRNVSALRAALPTRHSSRR